ncbi:MAG: hypothetical protein WAJ91_18190 [Rhodoplanes sp.]
MRAPSAAGLERQAQQELACWAAGRIRRRPVAARALAGSLERRALPPPARALVEPLGEQAPVEPPPERGPAWPPREPELALPAQASLA